MFLQNLDEVIIQDQRDELNEKNNSEVNKEELYVMINRMVDS